jgi:hypothetical protein
VSLNCSNQRAYCSSPRWYMNMETMLEWYRQWETPDSSTRAVWKSYQQSHLVAKQEELLNEMMNLTLQSAVFFVHISEGSSTCHKVLQHGLTALLPLRRKACCGFLSPLKIHRPWSGLNPRTLGPVASMPTNLISLIYITFLDWDMSDG